MTLAVVEAVLFGVDRYERVPERTTLAHEAMRVAVLGTTGAGNVSTLLTVFLIRVVSSTISYRLFSLLSGWWLAGLLNQGNHAVEKGIERWSW